MTLMEVLYYYTIRDFMKYFITIVIFCFLCSFTHPEEIPYNRLNLTGSADYAAERIKQKFPNVVFTDGARTLNSQADTIADNLIKSNNSNWVDDTYADSPFIKKLNGEITNNWNSIKGNKTLILQTINKVFIIDSEGAKSMSKHLSGHAFDIRVNCVNYNDLNNFVKTLPCFRRFLTQEGGLAVWHLEFEETILEGTWITVENEYMFIFSGSNYIKKRNINGWDNIEKGMYFLDLKNKKYYEYELIIFFV